MSAAQLDLVSEWQPTPLSTQDSTLYAVPHPGSYAVVLLATADTEWRERWVRVRVVGRVRVRWFGPQRTPSGFNQRLVLCEVPGEREPRDVAIERFAEVPRG